MTKFVALGRTVDGRLFPIAVDGQGRLIIAGNFSQLSVGTDTNYTTFATDGTMQAFGDATCWRDELQPITSLRITSPSNDFILNDTEVSVTCKNSARYPTDFVYTNIQLNHDWVLGTSLHPHLHWWQTSSNVPNWLITYRWQKQGSAKTTGWTPSKWSTNEFAYTSGLLNQITEFGTIVAPVGYGQASDILQVKLYRDFTNVSTLFVGNDPVNTNIEAVQFDIHIEVDMLGSHQEYIK